MGGFFLLGFAIVVAAVFALALIFFGLAIRNLVTRQPFWTGMRNWLAYPLIAILIILPVEAFYLFAARRGVDQHEAARWLNILIMAVFVFGYAMKGYWSFRRRWELWVVLSVLAAAHFLLLSYLPWHRGTFFLIFFVGIPEIALVSFVLGLIFLRNPPGGEQRSASGRSDET